MADVKFPAIHIAESVLNRLMNFRDELNTDTDAVAPPINPELPPTVADPSLSGAAIDQQTAQPTPPIAASGEDPTGVLPTVAQGGDLLESV